MELIHDLLHDDNDPPDDDDDDQYDVEDATCQDKSVSGHFEGCLCCLGREIPETFFCIKSSLKPNATGEGE